jgi:RNA polymerase sigma-70 factor (ECF subfamily)
VHSNQRERFEQLLDSECYACAWGYARRLSEQGGGTRHDAEDLLQEALAHAWRGLPGLRDAGRFKPWLFAIIRRRYLTRRSRQRPLQALDELPALPGPEADPLQRELLEALARLPEAPRELLSLFYLHGLSMQETAEVLGLAPGAVHMRLARARERLRHEFRPAAAAPSVECRETQGRLT